MQANDLEWLKENRARRLAAWASANLVVLIVYWRTNSILWALVASMIWGMIRYAPLLCQLDRLAWELRREKKAQQKNVLNSDSPTPVPHSSRP